MTDYYEELPREEQEKIKDIIRKLLRQTFILERKYDKKEGRLLLNKDYYFCEKHMEFLSWYLGVAGICLLENSGLGTIYIQGEDTIGEKLPMLATIYLLLFKLIYDEQMAEVSTSVNVVTTLGEVNSKAGEFRLVKAVSSMTEIKRALTILKKYQMIEVPDSLDECREQTRIIIFPSINVVLMRENIQKLLDSFRDETDGSPYSADREPDADNGDTEGEIQDGEQ